MSTQVNLTPSGSRVKAYLEGGPQLDAALQKLTRGLRDDLLKDATLAGGQVIAEEWKSRVPVDEGDYRNSITAKSRAGKKGATAIVAIDKGYDGGAGDSFKDISGRAVVLEWGTSGRGKATSGRGMGYRAAKPSARPAFDAARDRAIDAVEARLRELVEASTP